MIHALKNQPMLFEALTWREFKAVEQLLDRPGYRLSFLDGILEIQGYLETLEIYFMAGRREKRLIANLRWQNR